MKQVRRLSRCLFFPPGNPYSSQTTSGLLKCPTPPPAKSQSLNRKHSMELGQVGLLSPAALSPMGSTQSESSRVPLTVWLRAFINHCCANDSYWNILLQLSFSFPNLELLFDKCSRSLEIWRSIKPQGFIWYLTSTRNIASSQVCVLIQTSCCGNCPKKRGSFNMGASI